MKLPKLRVPMGQEKKKKKKNKGSLALFPKRNLDYSLPHTMKIPNKLIYRSHRSSRAWIDG